jgi:hypothetical protein
LIDTKDLLEIPTEQSCVLIVKITKLEVLSGVIELLQRFKHIIKLTFNYFGPMPKISISLVGIDDVVCESFKCNIPITCAEVFLSPYIKKLYLTNLQEITGEAELKQNYVLTDYKHNGKVFSPMVIVVLTRNRLLHQNSRFKKTKVAI